MPLTSTSCSWRSNLTFRPVSSPFSWHTLGWCLEFSTGTRTRSQTISRGPYPWTTPFTSTSLSMKKWSCSLCCSVYYSIASRKSTLITGNWGSTSIEVLRGGDLAKQAWSVSYSESIHTILGGSLVATQTTRAWLISSTDRRSRSTTSSTSYLQPVKHSIWTTPRRCSTYATCPQTPLASSECRLLFTAATDHSQIRTSRETLSWVRGPKEGDRRWCWDRVQRLGAWNRRNWRRIERS